MTVNWIYRIENWNEKKLRELYKAREYTKRETVVFVVAVVQKPKYEKKKCHFGVAKEPTHENQLVEYSCSATKMEM